MARQFQYDESGATFFYFLLSVLAIILIPATFFCWPKKRQVEQDDQNECNCSGCKIKRSQLEPLKEKEKSKGTTFKKVSIILGWIILFLLLWKITQLDVEAVKFDPFEILGVDPSASDSQIKRAFRKLSVLHHPDKGGNEELFIKITKAYQALTDETARKNWEEYGNPDGPGAIVFGIALPSWIVAKENSILVLAFYVILFAIILPIFFVIWYIKKMKGNNGQVLLETQKMYFWYLKKSKVDIKRLIMILGASLEFSCQFNSEIVKRESDNEEVPKLLKQIPNLNEKNKEYILSFPFSVKARTLIHAHLHRMPLNPKTLELDKKYLISKCPFLIQEQIKVIVQIIQYIYMETMRTGKQSKNIILVDTLELCMKLSQMIVQALWEHKSPFLQLPHITESHLKYFTSKKRRLNNLQSFAQTSLQEKKSILRTFSEEEFNDIIKVLGEMPLIKFDATFEVLDDIKPEEIHTEDLITVTVTLERENLKSLFRTDPDLEIEENEEGEEEVDEKPKQPVWMKQKRSVKKSNNAKKTRKRVKAKLGEEEPEEEEKEEAELVENTEPSEEESKDDEEDDDEVVADEGWKKFQRLQERNKVFESKSNISHEVHCPYFPNEKQEYWWLYLYEKKSRCTLEAPVHITNLKDQEVIKFNFQAHSIPGTYTYVIGLKSDSYIGFDQLKEFKIDVKQADEKIKNHPQWKLDESDKEEEENENLSDYTTDEDIED